MQPQPDRVAARLGFDERMIARLRARGRLERLALTEPEIRERLYRAHLAHLPTHTPRWAPELGEHHRVEAHST